MTPLQRLEELATLVGVWRSAKCRWPMSRSDGGCAGDNHREGCAVQIALNDVIAAHNALGAPGMP